MLKSKSLLRGSITLLSRESPYGKLTRWTTGRRSWRLLRVNDPRAQSEQWNAVGVRSSAILNPITSCQLTSARSSRRDARLCPQRPHRLTAADAHRPFTDAKLALAPGEGETR